MKVLAGARRLDTPASRLFVGVGAAVAGSLVAGCPRLPELEPLALVVAAAAVPFAGRWAGVGCAAAAALATALARGVSSGESLLAALVLLLAGAALSLTVDPLARSHRSENAPASNAAQGGHALVEEIASLAAAVREAAAHASAPDLGALVVAGGPLAELGTALSLLLAGLNDVLSVVRAEARTLAAAGAELEGSASSSMAVMDGGTIAQTQLEEGITEQARIIDGALIKVRAMIDAIAELASGAEQQKRALDETALDASTMSASIEEVSAQVDSVLTISQETSATAERGGTAIHTIVEAMATIKTTIAELAADIRRLGTNSEQIGDIVKVIDGIAEQTNLLALNAAIEAARAGEHGRGFAVVATEIRKLADGSVQATKEIAGHVGSTQAVIAQVTDAMDRLDERLEESVRSTDNASEALRAIVAAVLDANRQIAQISSVTRSMSENAFRVIRAIEETTRGVGANLAAAQQMAAHSSGLSGAFDAIASISSQNASSVEVLTYVNAEVGASVQNIVGSVGEMTRRAAAIDAQLERYAGDRTQEETAV